MGASARTPVIIGAVTILVLALLSLLAPSTATYDPWAWIIWGREVVHGDLNTISGPSWKPLPVVVTSIAALFGDIAPDIWIVVARAGALAGVAAAFLLGRRIAGTTAGLLGAAPLLLAPWFFKHGWFANSEGLLVMFVLGAVLAELDRRRGVAMACWIAAALLRPEAWPFLLIYAAWVAWRSDLRGRTAVLAALCVLPPAWLLPEKWGSGDYWRASTRAQNPDPGSASLTAHPWWTIVRNFWDMLPTVTWVAVAAAVVVGAGLAVARRGRATPATGAAAVDPVDGETASAGPAPNGAGAPATGSAPVAAAASPRVIGPWAVVAGLAILGLAWLALVAVMTERGYSGNERYLIQPAALLIVAAAGAVGLVLRSLPRPAHVALAALAFAGIAVTAIQQMPGQVRREVYEGRLVDDLNRAIDRAGGPDRLKACGPVGTLNIMVPQVAWALGEHAVDIQNATGPGPKVVLRLKIRKDAPLSPAVTRVPSMPELVRTPYWQIEAADCAAAGGSTR
ncbi:hypothetical protein AB0L40_19065 [Patulibacter sp. NPDC049589]|uniref:hypothetical protein n=1 Tax=Patulibacter sp. NPDC049589 TaxID=3154731 RepID=UPI003427DF00